MIRRAVTPPPPQWEQHYTPGGKSYWTRPEDPGYGYIDDPRTNGDYAAIRYPIDYINYVWGTSPTVPPPETTRETATGQQAREMTASALEGRITIAYGAPPPFGGALIGWRANGPLLWASYSVCEGPIQAIDAVLDSRTYLPFTTGGTFQTTLGLAAPIGPVPSFYTQVTNSAGTELFPYLATAHAAWDMTVFSGEPKPLFKVRGRLVYDPRTGLVAWSDNPALCLADFLTNDVYGLGVPVSKIDWTSVGAAADYCDFVVGADSVSAVDVVAGGESFASTTTLTFTPAPAGGITAAGEAVMVPASSSTWRIAGITITEPGKGYTVRPTVTASGFATAPTLTAQLGEKRHAINWAIMPSKDTSRSSIVDTMRALFRCTIIQRNGKRVFVVDQPVARTMVLNRDNSRPIRLEKFGPSQRPNVVKVGYTNPRKNYQTDYAYAYTDAARTGLEDQRPVEFTLEGETRDGGALRQAEYLLGELRTPIKVEIAPTTAAALQLEVFDRIGYYSPTLGLGASDASPQELRIRSLGKRPDGTFRLIGKVYDESYLSDAFKPAEASPITTAFPDPHAAPPAPTALVLQEVAFQKLNGLWGSRAQVNWTNIAYSLRVRYRVTTQRGTDPETQLGGLVDAGSVYFDLADEVATYTVRIYSVVEQSGVASAALVGTITASSPATVEPIGYFSFGTDADGKSIAWFEPPPIRSTTRYGAAAWSSSAMPTFVAASMNDGAFGSTAAVFGNGSWVRLDAGAPISLRELLLYSASALTSWPDLDVAYSDNGTTYTSCSAPFTTLNDSAGMHRRAAQIAPTIGAHRYWFIVAAVGAAAAFTEIQPLTYTGTWPYARGFRITGYVPTNGTASAQALKYTKDYFFQPTSTRGVKLDDFTFKWAYVDPFTASGGGGSLWDIEVATISVTGDVGDVRAISGGSTFATTGTPGVQNWIPAGRAEVTLTSGVDNNDLALSNVVDLFVLKGALSGTTGLTGLTNGYGGRIVTLYNAANTAVRLRSNVTSIAANRFLFPVATFDLAPGASVTLIYDDDGGTAPRWRPAVTSLIGILGRANGGTGVDLSATGGAGQVLKQLTAGGAITVAALAAAELPNIPESQVTNLVTDLAAKAPLASPALTGTPTAPTAALGTNTTQIATTAFVLSNAGMEHVTAVPNAVSHATVALSSLPKGARVTQVAVVNASYVTVVSVTGKGMLRYLEHYTNTGGNAAIRVTVDGSFVLNLGLLTNTDPFCYVGNFTGAYNSANANYDCIRQLAEAGWPFKSSLLVECQNINGSQVLYNYVLY